MVNNVFVSIATGSVILSTACAVFVTKKLRDRKITPPPLLQQEGSEIEAQALRDSLNIIIQCRDEMFAGIHPCSWSDSKIAAAQRLIEEFGETGSRYTHARALYDIHSLERVFVRL